MAADAAPRRPLAIGLTGGIASGKSAVAAAFAKLGVPLIDTDVVAREVVAPGEPGLTAVVAAFGPEILKPDGTLDRAALRAVVFADDARRRELESILHPLIRARVRERLAAIEAPYVIVVVPLLVETDFKDLVDRVLVVDCPEPMQLERLMQRDAIPRDAALAMIRAQVDRAARLKAADDIIDNSGARDAVRAQVERLHARYTSLAANR